ncbi:MAG: beta strand repeat-containing protein [Verrucomicrobiota bacterium]
MKKTLLLLAILSFANPAFAQTAFTGNYTWSANGNVSSFAYNGVDIANLTEGAFTKNGVTTSSSSGNFRASGFALDPVVGNLTGANDPAKYFEFGLTADSGFTLSMTNINFGVGRSGFGPRTFVWSTSVDSFATILTNYTVSGNVTNNAGVITIPDTTSTALTNIVLDLSAASFQNLTNITFRFYAYNSEAAGGTGGFQGPLSFSGSLLNTNPVTGGAYWSVDPAGGGSGTWTSEGTTWAKNPGGAGAGETQSTSTLIFADTAGTVTVSGGVSVSNGMTFQTTGYTVQSGTVTLAGASAANNALTVDTGLSSTISSELAGTTGMTKAGAGTLILSGSNSFAGNAVISGGTLQIANDSALGNAANDLANNGTLKTTASVSLDAGRDISGSGTYDIADGTTLTVNGSINNTVTTLSNTGTLNVQGATRSLGSVTLNSAGTLNAAGSINATALTASGVTSGSATINPDINFSSGTKTVNVGAGGNLVLNGALSGATFLAKTGSGNLSINGVNTVQTRIGAAGASPTAGGTVTLGSAASGGNGSIQLNSGTLRGASSFVLNNGLTVGGRTNGVAVLGGGNMEFQGASAFFRGTGTTGELILNVDNTTTFSGGFNATSGGGSATGITLGGTGEVVISGNSSALVDTITLTNTVKLTLNEAIGGGLNVGASNVLAGNGSIGGSLSLASGAKIVFSLTDSLTVNGPSISFGGFGVTDLIGLDNTVPNGTYTVFDGLATVNTNNLLNFGEANAHDLGGGKSAFFTEGSLLVNVVPESSVFVLLAFAGAGFGAHLLRRRR